jgi:Holliday junction resolvase RusA-like endonuclease
LRPYWRVENEVYKVYGAPKSAAARKRIAAIISKIRKRMRKLDPRLEMYYQMFYSSGG